MNTSTSTPIADPPQLGFFERLGVWASWGMGGWIFLTAGWMIMRPADPLGPVSLFSGQSGLLVVALVAALSGVTAALATVIAGRKLVDAGTFSVALGLALVSLRGETAGYFVLQSIDPAHAPKFWQLPLESLGWLLVIGVAICVSDVVMRWCHPKAVRELADPSTDRVLAVPAGFELRAFGSGAAARTPLRIALTHTVVVAVAGLIAFTVLSAGLATRAIEHGQACFVVAASVCVACYVAYRIAPVRSALWSILGVGLLTIGAYLWVTLTGSAGSNPPGVPASPFLRVLPLQYISVGTAAAVAMTWYAHDPYRTPARSTQMSYGASHGAS